jgi:hypothetical protein
MQSRRRDKKYQQIEKTGIEKYWGHFFSFEKES